MPQLDFSNPLMLSKLVWLLIIFGLLYFVLKNYALPQVAAVLDERAARIAADLDAARDAQAAGEAAMAELRAATAAARSEAQAAVASAIAEANAKATAEAEAINRRLDAQVAEAESRVRAARDSAMGALREVALDTTQAMLGRLRVHAPANDVAAAVDRAAGGRG
ncbi:F0F1 ATP synthase subunit B family protein [Sabulicella glaciei]|uniref:ATP synthase subunit b n=1 Tax=Sabulicella glaciei TaxID=2984948 RepID=A0ABT3NZ67_9PROT|nr:F0F1 ATP synthase subunit B' [Roseococcus sp. MDT2-1-1]MCW8087233.1 F0F1 ATP synthase subunit B' [Roseococcus sp. MDT2-1-1]